MLIVIAAFFRNFTYLHRGSQKKLFRCFHPFSGQKINKGITRRPFDKRAQIIGAYRDLGTDGIERQFRVRKPALHNRQSLITDNGTTLFPMFRRHFPCH